MPVLDVLPPSAVIAAIPPAARLMNQMTAKLPQPSDASTENENGCEQKHNESAVLLDIAR
jgi:hypothetical protein